jgi:hypothetical protein
MDKRRGSPFTQFNFVVEIGDENEGDLVGGFDEVSGLSVEDDAAAIYTSSDPIKVSLRRGGIRVDWFNKWREAIEEGCAVQNEHLLSRQQGRSEVALERQACMDRKSRGAGSKGSIE